MSSRNSLHVILPGVFLILLLFHGDVVRGSTITFTVPKNYGPASTLDRAQYKEGELIVRFAAKTDGVQRTVEERDAILARFGAGKVAQTYKLVAGLSLIKLPAGVKVAEVLGDTNKAQEVLYAQPNYMLTPLVACPNDPNFADQWGQPMPISTPPRRGISLPTPIISSSQSSTAGSITIIRTWLQICGLIPEKTIRHWVLLVPKILMELMMMEIMTEMGIL